MKQFDLVNKLRERLNNLELEESRLLEVIKRLEKDLADWKSRTQYANRISYLERDLRVDAEARLAKAESLIVFVVTEDVGDESGVRGVFTDLEQAVQTIGMETVMTGWEIGFGFAVIFVALGVMFALWINNTPSSDEISAAEMEKQYAEYLVTMDMRQKRRAQREAEDERRLKEEA
jgi:hypothetical protein